MDKDISIAQGLALTPYSDVSPDGQLSVAHNVEVYNGSLRPSVIQGTEFTLPGELLYIHATQNYTHYLYYDDEKNVRYAIKTDDGIYIPQSGRTGMLLNLVVSHTHVSNISSVNHIGNVLVFLQPDQEVYYAIWNGQSTEGYTDLGTIPDLNVTFSLTCDSMGWRGSKNSGLDDDHRDDDLVYQYEEEVEYTKPSNLDEIHKDNYNVFGALLGAIEKQVCNCEDGGFIYPFFVRAAWRLYDGSHIKLTPPVLMVPNDHYIGNESITTDEGKVETCWLEIALFVCKLYYQVENVPTKWNSIISGIDIFVSLPINEYCIEPNDDIFELYEHKDIPCVTYSDLTEETIDDLFGRFSTTREDLIGYLKKIERFFLWKNNYGFYLAGNTTTYKRALKEKSTKDIEALEETCSYLLLKKINLDDLTTDRTKVYLEKGEYESISTQDALVDEYTSRERPSATLSFSYNNRINLANCTNGYIAGFGIESLPDSSLYSAESESTYKFYYKIVRDGVERYIFAFQTNRYADVNKIRYIFNPNTYAKYLVITKDDTYYDEIKLKEYDLIHGNYYCNLSGKTLDFSKTIDFTVSDYTMDIDTLKNAIYTSEINNPFLFPLIGQNTVGNGEIKALSTITKALSEGQYGSFPLMAFCTDGNYSLGMVTEGDNAGIINSVNAMQPDVCINADSVTQIEDGILFVSGRGVMLASANQIGCISVQLDGVNDTLANSLLSEFDERLTASGTTTFEDVSARKFFEDTTGVIWDYISQRAIFVNKNYDIAYVLTKSQDNTCWSTINLKKYVKKIINVYPYSYVQWADNSVTILDDDYNFDETSSPSSCLLLTRPLKLDTLQLKKMDSYLLQGIYSQAQKTSIWGSNDCKTWTKLGSTTRKEIPHIVGRYYKYWRIGVELSLNEAEEISGMRVKYTPRTEGRLR